MTRTEAAGVEQGIVLPEPSPTLPDGTAGILGMHSVWFKSAVLCLFLLMGLSNPLPAQNTRAEGYRGIWFTLGQFSAYGDKYSGGLGTYTSSHVPVAIYSKAAHKTFFVYGGTTQKDQKHLQIMISYYDHHSKRVPKPVIVYDKAGVNDPHDNASLAMDDQGYIWVFVSGRNTSRMGIIFKSREPYAIHSFDKVLETEMTYPQPWWFNGKGFLFLFTRYTRGRELYWSTSTDGLRWATAQKLAGMGGHYQVSNMWNGKLVTVFNYHPGGNVDKRTNLYAVQTTDMGNTWTTIDGRLISTPLQRIQHPALIRDFEKEGKLVYLNDLNFDEAGNPVILAVVSRDFKPGPGGDPREWVILHHTARGWHYQTVTTSTHNYDMGSLYIHKNNWRIVGPTDAGPQLYGTGGEMVMWESRNAGKSWRKKRLLTENSQRNHAYARRPVSAHPDFYAFWADGNTDSLSESVLYFCNKKGNKVWKLPYTMQKDMEKPVLLKNELQSGNYKTPF